MKRTPSSARWIARSVLIAVAPTYWPTSPARSTSTRWPRLSRPIARYISASRRAIVVLPVPGLPRKTRCCEVATSGSPCSARRACTWRNATSARTCSFTVSRPTSASSSAWSSSRLRPGSGGRIESRRSAIHSVAGSLATVRRSCSPSVRRPRATSSSGFGIGRSVPRPGEAAARAVSLTWLTNMPTVAADPVTVANRLRPALLKLNRQLRREIHSLGITGGQVSLLVEIKASPGIGVRELAARERMSAPGMSKYVARLEAAGLVRRSVGADRRRVGLELTPEGQRVLRSVKSRRTAWLADRLRDLEPEELEAVEAAVEPLYRLLGADG